MQIAKLIIHEYKIIYIYKFRFINKLSLLLLLPLHLCRAESIIIAICLKIKNIRKIRKNTKLYNPKNSKLLTLTTFSILLSFSQ